MRYGDARVTLAWAGPVARGQHLGPLLPPVTCTTSPRFRVRINGSEFRVQGEGFIQSTRCPPPQMLQTPAAALGGLVRHRVDRSCREHQTWVPNSSLHLDADPTPMCGMQL